MPQCHHTIPPHPGDNHLDGKIQPTLPACDSHGSDLLRCFSPVVDQRTRTLILGSMPGRVSLAETQYYAHPRNGFWHIMGELYGARFDVPYSRRLAILLANGIGLWDVIASCRRTTSLDSDIDNDSIQANDFYQLLSRYPGITRIFFNGAKAEQTFKRQILPNLQELPLKIELQRLISISPANARYSLADKIATWREQLHPLALR